MASWWKSRRRVGVIAVAAAALATAAAPSNVAAGQALSEACASLNDPALDARYTDSVGFLGGFVTGLAAGEEVTVAATGNPEANMILGTTDEFGLDIDTTRPFEITHTVGSIGTFAWTSGLMVNIPILEPVEADWTVSCGLPDPVVISPYGVLLTEPAAGEAATVQVPVRMFGGPSAAEVTVGYRTVDGQAAPEATAGEDFVSASGTVTFSPGETVAYAEVEILGDGLAEPPLYGGEWLLIEFDDPAGNAILDTDLFFGHGLVIIVDVDS